MPSSACSVADPTPGALGVPLADLDELLRRSGLHPDGLAAAVIALTGPVTVRADVLAREKDTWSAAFDGVIKATAGQPKLVVWLQRVRSTGLVKRLAPDPARARELLDVLACARRPAGRRRVAEHVLGPGRRPCARAGRRRATGHARARRGAGVGGDRAARA